MSSNHPNDRYPQNGHYPHQSLSQYFNIAHSTTGHAPMTTMDSRRPPSPASSMTLVSRRRPRPYEDDYNNSARISTDENMNSNELSSGPWQALKRLRVDAAAVVVGQNETPAPPRNHTNSDVVAELSTRSSSVDVNTTQGPTNHHQYFYQRHQLQEAGQDTMSDGWGSPETAVASLQRPSPLSSAHHENGSDDDDDDNDMEYQNVNQILGNLHFERRQRNTSATPQQQQSSVRSYKHEPSLSSQSTTMQTTPTNAHRTFLSPSYNYQTPPPKPTKRKIVRLFTNSKIG
jgi:hypothetical protein